MSVGRQPGELPCPATGEAHEVESVRVDDGPVWVNRCFACGEMWVEEAS